MCLGIEYGLRFDGCLPLAPLLCPLSCPASALYWSFFLGLCAAKRRNKVVAACRLKTISAGSSISICRLPIARDARPLPPPLPLPRPQHSCTRRRRRRRSLINTELVGNSISNTRPLMDWLPVCLLTPLCPPSVHAPVYDWCLRLVSSRLASCGRVLDNKKKEKKREERKKKKRHRRQIVSVRYTDTHPSDRFASVDRQHVPRAAR